MAGFLSTLDVSIVAVSSAAADLLTLEAKNHRTFSTEAQKCWLVSLLFHSVRSGGVNKASSALYLKLALTLTSP